MAQQQISLVRTQQASKQRELRMAQLTQTEVSALPTDTAVYEGVGKMYVASLYLSPYPEYSSLILLLFLSLFPHPSTSGLLWSR